MLEEIEWALEMAELIDYIDDAALTVLGWE